VQTTYSYIDLIQLDTEVLRETQATIPLSVDQRQQLEDVVLSLQGRIQECTQRLFEDEVRLEQSLEMDKTHETALEDLTARLKRDEQAVQQWIEDTRRQYKTPVPEGVNPKRSRGRQEEINETIEALQNRLDDMHQLTTFDNDSFRDMVNVELDRYASRGMAKNVLEATELYSLDQLEEELKGLVEKLDESERKIRVLEAREEARAEELRKWMEEDARVYLLCFSLFYLLQCPPGRGADPQRYIGSRTAQCANGDDHGRLASSQYCDCFTALRRRMAVADD